MLASEADVDADEVASVGAVGDEDDGAVVVDCGSADVGDGGVEGHVEGFGGFDVGGADGEGLAGVGDDDAGEAGDEAEGGFSGEVGGVDAGPPGCVEVDVGEEEGLAAAGVASTEVVVGGGGVAEAFWDGGGHCAGGHAEDFDFGAFAGAEEAAPVGLDFAPEAFGWGDADEGAFGPEAFDEAFGFDLVEGLADCCAGDAVFGRKFVDGGDAAAGAPDSGLDPAAEEGCELDVAGDGAAVEIHGPAGGGGPLFAAVGGHGVSRGWGLASGQVLL